MVLAGNKTVTMDLMTSRKPVRMELMQNCDLPPPSKVFMGSDKAVVLSVNEICGRKMGYHYQDDRDGEDLEIHGQTGLEEDKPDVLLRALKSAQTRAREKEKKVACLIKERDCLSELLLAEAMNGFSYCQQLRLLELQVSKLKSELQQQQQTSYCNYSGSKEDENSDEDGEDKTSLTWMAAMALCWGLAGVGIALGCRYFI